MDHGWKVEFQYVQLKEVVDINPLMHKILVLQPSKYAPYNRDGNGNGGYVYSAGRDLAMLLLREMQHQQPSEYSNEIYELRNRFKLLEASEINVANDHSLIEDVNTCLEVDTHPEYLGVPQEKQPLVEQKATWGYPRNCERARNALKLADYKCEIDETHPAFTRKKNGLPYTEPHHLIPVSRYADFVSSLDVEENIVSLCSHCHNQLHYGSEFESLLKKLYMDRKDMLERVGIGVVFDKLKSYYM